MRGTFRSGSCVLALLSELAGGDRSYEELKAALDGIAHGRLSDAFKGSERSGVITRDDDARRAEAPTLYQLAEFGRSLEYDLSNWADVCWASVELGRNRWEGNGR